MSTPIVRMVCRPVALDGAPAGWASEMLADGEIALLADDGGLPAIDAVAHALGLLVVPLLRTESTAGRADTTVMAYADSLPLVWVAPAFSDVVRSWATQRGPMTLLVEAAGALPEDERRRIDRFVALLGRQAE